MGGVRHATLHNIAKKIWHWAEKRNIYLFASYIPSKENTDADRLSKVKNIDTEWELNNEYFNIVVNKFGQPESIY